MTVKAIASYLGRFLELRLRAFVYACFTMVGFLIGLWIGVGMAAAIVRAAL